MDVKCTFYGFCPSAYILIVVNENALQIKVYVFKRNYQLSAINAKDVVSEDFYVDTMV